MSNLWDWSKALRSLLVPHAPCIGVETFQVWFIVANTSWSRLRDPTSVQLFNFCHAIPLLITCTPGFSLFLPSKFSISGSLATGAGVKGSEKSRKYDLMYQSSCAS